jgi:hypothetical protein
MFNRGFVAIAIMVLASTLLTAGTAGDMITSGVQGAIETHTPATALPIAAGNQLTESEQQVIISDLWMRNYHGEFCYYDGETPSKTITGFTDGDRVIFDTNPDFGTCAK